MCLARRLAWIALALALLGVDLLITDPAVFPRRQAILAVTVGFALVAGVAAMRVRRRATAMLFAVCTAFAMWQGARPSIDRMAVLARSGAEVEAIERHFVVGYTDRDGAREAVSRGHVGGLFLTRRNVDGRTAAEVAAEIGDFQAMRRGAGGPPLVIAADQEGGAVSHLSPPLPRPPALSTSATLRAGERRDAARRLGRELGVALRDIGVTMDLAPVSDLTPSTLPDALDLHTRIATRTISGDPNTVAEVAAGFSEGLLASGVTPTAKHFPGLGRVSADTHLFSASLDATTADLAARDWIPFRRVLGIGGTAVMLSHVSLDAVDRDVPASRSKPLVDGLLRGQWGFEGIAITDDLTMGAVAHAGLCRAVEGALNAGIDLLLVSWDVDKTYPALRCALEALDAGRLDRAMLDASGRRLDKLTAARSLAHDP